MVWPWVKVFNRSAERRRVAGNVAALSVIQAADYLIPLLTMPYLVRVLGPDGFGLLAFATATVAYAHLLVDYGFNLTATRRAAIIREQTAALSQLYSSVLFIKLGLMVLSVAALAVIVAGVPRLAKNWQLLAMTCAALPGQALFSAWLFQGLQQMKYLTYLNVGAKLFAMVGILVLVDDRADYMVVPALYASGAMISGVSAMVLARQMFKLRLFWPGWSALRVQLLDGWHVFMSSVAISLYTVSVTFVLGWFSNPTQVGYFAAADKIVQAVKGLYTPIGSALYPLLSQRLHADRAAGLALVRRVTLVCGGVMLAVSGLLAAGAGPIVRLLLGPDYMAAVPLVQIMAWVPWMVTLSNIFGIQTMLNLGYTKLMTGIVMVAGFWGMAASIVLVQAWASAGAAWVVLGVEVFVTVAMALALKVKLRAVP